MGIAIKAPASSGGGMTNPMTTANDIIVGGASGTPTRLGKGANGLPLGVNGSGNLAYLTGVNASTLNGMALVTANAAIGQIFKTIDSANLKLMTDDIIDVREHGAVPAFQGVTGTITNGSTQFDDTNVDFTSPTLIPELGRALQAGDCIYIARGRSGYKWHPTTIAAVAPGGVTTRLTLTAAPNTTITAGNARYSVGPSGQHTAINAALTRAYNRGYGRVYLSGHFFTSGTVFGLQRTSLFGDNHRGAGLLLAPGSNAHVFRNKVSSNGTTDTNAEFVQAHDFMIVGAASQQSGTWHGVYLSVNPLFTRLANRGDEEDDMQHILYNLYISDCIGDGLFWEGLASHYFYAIDSENNTRHGYNGTSDTHTAMLVAGLNGQRGFNFAVSASSQFVGCKSFSNGGNLHSDGYGWYMGGRAGALTLLACDAQENFAQGFYLAGCNGAKIYGTAESNGAKGLPSNAEGLVPAITIDDSYNCDIKVSCHDANWNADGGSQKNAFEIINGSYNNAIDVQHFAGDKGYGYAEIGAPVVAGSATDLNNVNVNAGQNATAVSGWYGTTPVTAWGVAGAPSVTNVALGGATGVGARTLWLSYSWMTRGGVETPAGPTTSITTTSGSPKLRVTAPSSFPTNAWALVIYVGTANNTTTMHRQSRVITKVSATWTEGDQGYLTTGAAPFTVVTMQPNPYLAATVQQTLGGNLVVTAPQYAHTGQVLNLTFVQDATGGRKLIWPSSGTQFQHTVIQNLLPNTKTNLTFIFDGTNWVQASTSPALIFANPSVAGGDTLSNFTGPTAFATKATIPAGQLKAGQVIRIRQRGIYSDTGTPTFAIDLLGGSAGTTVLVSGTNAITGGSGVTAAEWDVVIDIVVLSLSGVSGAAGVTASCEIHGVFTLQQGNANSSARGIRNSTTGNAVSLATDVDNIIGFQVTCSAASASNTITQKELMLEQAA